MVMFIPGHMCVLTVDDCWPKEMLAPDTLENTVWMFCTWALLMGLPIPHSHPKFLMLGVGVVCFKLSFTKGLGVQLSR